MITGSLCVLLLLAACEVTPSEQFKPQLVVHGLVLAWSPSIQANINRSYAVDEPFDTMFPGVSGAVWRGADTWPIANSVRDVYATGELPYRPYPGATFGIRVAKEGFDTVYGQTVVPDSFGILFPRDGDTVTMMDSMVWKRSRNCAGYYMSFRSVDRGDTFYYDAAIPNDTTGGNFDSLRFKLPQMVFLYLFESGRHTLRIYALDTSYFSWVNAGGFGPGTGASDSTRLTGGLGVFGSGVGESVDVYVKKDTASVESRNEVVKRSSDRVVERQGVRTPHWTTGAHDHWITLPASQLFRDPSRRFLTPDGLGTNASAPDKGKD